MSFASSFDLIGIAQCGIGGEELDGDAKEESTRGEPAYNFCS